MFWDTNAVHYYDPRTGLGPFEAAKKALDERVARLQQEQEQELQSFRLIASCPETEKGKLLISLYTALIAQERNVSPITPALTALKAMRVVYPE